MKQNIFGRTIPELQDSLAEFKIPAYRAKQIAEWMYKRYIDDFAKMDNLPLTMRTLLAEHFEIVTLKLLNHLTSSDQRTTKLLLSYPDGIAVETVLMRQSYGNSVCVSTQAGCNMGCVFCASTVNGMARNLTATEILAQVLYINRLLSRDAQKVNTLVIMGSGEPLANYDAVLTFIRLCHDPAIFNLGYRNITLSTAGIVPMIERLATEELPITLSISLHAPNDEIRAELMPINEKYNIAQVVAAGRLYGEKTSRRVTYEYILIDGKNDSVLCAQQLSKLLRGQIASVNLIPINPVVERNLNRPSPAKISVFAETLLKNHIVATVRKEMGNDIQAACGQLRNQQID